LKKAGTISFLLGLLMGWSVLSYGQILPFQVEQNQLDRSNPLRDLRVNPQANGIITERQAVNLARQQFAGNILRITLIGEGAEQRYQMRMEDAGKVFTVFVHARTGEVTGGT
jgi:uncharacterized membrane protein YkoI